MSYFVDQNGVNFQRQLNSMSDGFIFEETSVDSWKKVPQINPKAVKTISSFWHFWWNYVQNKSGLPYFPIFAEDLVSSFHHYLSAKNYIQKYTWG